MKKQVTKKKRNPPDSTFRNITALKKRVNELETWVVMMQAQINILRNATKTSDISDGFSTFEDRNAFKKLQNKVSGR
jgi:hypothetical protein